jgi:hypothetical protein
MVYPNMKEKLMSIVQEGDEALLQLIYDTVEEYNKEENGWSKKEMKWLNAQAELRKNGLIRTVAWADAKTQIVDRLKALGK